MTSSSKFNLIFSVIIAAIVYFAIPYNLMGANMALAIGILFAGIVIPIASKIVSSLPAPSVASNGEAATTLYVGNLPYKADEESVSEHFSQHGNVESVRLMKDRRTGKRKGYGFVEVDGNSADKMIKALNDTEFQERTLKVRLAKEKPEAE